MRLTTRMINRRVRSLSAMMLLSSLALFMSACGGGGGDNATFANSQTLINVIECNTTGATIPDDFITMNSGDVIVKDTANTVITTYHDVNGTKKICVDSGVAHLVRK